MAIVDDITIMGTLDAVKAMDSARERLQKQYVYTTNENHVAKIQMKLQDHIVICVGNEHGFKPHKLIINAALQSNVDKKLHAIAKLEN